MVGDDLRGLTPAIMKAAPAAAMIGMQGVKAVIELEQPGSKIESEGSHWWAAQLHWLRHQLFQITYPAILQSWDTS